jgi:hypothetical protein
MQQLAVQVFGLGGAEPVEADAFVALVGLAGADGDPGQAEHPVQQVGGDVDGAHPVPRHGQHPATQEAAAHLHVGGRDAV